jgi:carbamoyltransferase
MIVLGLSIFEQNPAAAIIIDGEIVAYAEEERFIRFKNADGFFPIKAVEFCLKKTKVKLEDLDQIAVGWDYQKYQWFIPWFSFKSSLKHWPSLLQGSQSNSFLLNILSRKPALIKKKIILALGQIEKTVIEDKINFFSHHLSHAASAFYPSPFKKSLVLVMDGSGEERAISVYRGQGHNLEELSKTELPHSLGWFYAAFSAFLGFQPYSEAGFLMGLAAYGEVQADLLKKIENILEIKDGQIKVNGDYLLLGKHNYHEDFSDLLLQVFGEQRLKNEEITQDHRDLARTVQYHLEETVLKYLTYLKKRYRLHNLCLAGGLAQNVKLNGRIKESGLFKSIFIQPISHDGGAAIGAGLLASLELGSKRSKLLQNVYLGPSYSNQEIKDLLDNAKVKYKKLSFEKISQLTAQALAKNKIVAWFQGSMEGGPRALGNRSILANPLNPKIPDLVNQQVKYRDAWRPFCPSVTEEKASRYFENIGEEGKYMIVAYQVKKSMQKNIAAVTHIDGSARPQLVDKKNNPRFHQLLKDFGKLTGHEILINTSLNVKGEPIACTPLDALRCFFSTGIDILVIGDFILYK